MALYKHILLATDLSETCNKVTHKAVSLAKLYQAELTLVHTIEPLPAYGYPGVTDLESPIIDSATQQLEKMCEGLNVPKENQRIEFGSVKAQVLKVAQALSIDLIIIGSHGRHGLSRLLGSNASGIVHGAKCDVLTVQC